MLSCVAQGRVLDGSFRSHYNNVGFQCESLSILPNEGAAASMLHATVFLPSLVNVPVGELPPSWIAAKTGEGPGSVWKVVEDPTSPSAGKALAQTSAEGPKRLFIECYFDGKRYLDVKDDTFPKAGKIGLWTKADARTHFAGLRASEK